MEKNNLIQPPRIGEIVEGKVVGKAKSAVYLDLGAIGTGIIYGKEFQAAKYQLKNLEIGNILFVKIIELETEEGYIDLSLSGASRELAWDTLKEKKEKDETITVKILGANKGGLLAEIAKIPAFLPVSRLSSEYYPKVENGDTSKILRELQKFIGKDMEVKILDLDPKEEKLILSQKANESDKIKEILKSYKVGDVVEGEITGITDFGAFIKFPAATKDSDKNCEAGYPEFIEGLIHISELDWQLIEDPGEIVKVGEKVKAKIIEISSDKVSLSLKSLKKDPWLEIENQYKKGDVVEGKVTKINPFGAFVQISPKIQGLCHISEFGTKIKMEEKLGLEKKYKFEILLINPTEHRMSLKLVE